MLMQGMMEAMEKTYNSSQLTAVTAGLSGDPVVLIQVHALLLWSHKILMRTLRCMQRLLQRQGLPPKI